MDDVLNVWHFPDMSARQSEPSAIPAWQLYGEDRVFPDVLHCERIADRAAGLDWVIAPHRHLYLHQFFLIEQGEAAMTVDGAHVHLDLPALVTLPRGAVHGFAFAKATSGYVVTVPTQELPEIFQDGSPLATPMARFYAGSADAEAMTLFQRIFVEYGQSGAVRNAMVRSLATQIACLVLRHTDAGATTTTQTRDPRLLQFEALVLAQFRHRWQVADYARAIGISPRHLTRLCQGATGISAAHHVDVITFREASRLLVYTRMSAASVGYALGFDDPSYFSRAFQRHTGLSPTAYRARFDR